MQVSSFRVASDRHKRLLKPMHLGCFEGEHHLSLMASRKNIYAFLHRCHAPRSPLSEQGALLFCERRRFLTNFLLYEDWQLTVSHLFMVWEENRAHTAPQALRGAPARAHLDAFQKAFGTI